METLLYMLAQSQNTLPPAGFTAPDWYTLARSWEAADERAGGAAARSAVIKFEAGSIILGHDDDDGADFDIKATRATDDIADLNEQLGNPEFGWDNEHPPRKVDVGAYSISANPITNGEYVEYLSATGKTDYPSSWVDLSAGSTNGDGHTNGLHVRTVYGPVDMRVAKLWPVQASGAQLADYAAWKGGRLPTHAELRQFLDATHGPNCTDRPGTNIGFRNWHPVPAQLPRKDVDGRWLPGHNGGVWEWTSTPFMPHEGFRDSALYPGYSRFVFSLPRFVSRPNL